MPSWKAIKDLATKQIYRHPIATTALGAGLGAGAGKLVAPDEYEGLGTRLGLLAGAAGSLAHPGVRQALGNWARRQAFAYTGRIPKSHSGKAEEYIRSIQSQKVQHPEVSLASKAWEKARRAVGRPARELEAGKPMDEILAAHAAGMSNLPARFRLLRKDPKEFARQWWRHGGRADLMQVPLWTAPTLMGLRGQSSEEKKRTLADSIGGTAGWLAFSGLPTSVWMPASMLAGHLAGRAVGDVSPKPRRYERIHG